MTKNQAVAEDVVKNIESAYIDKEDRVLDPNLIDKPLLDRMPSPTGWRILILP